MTRWAFRSPKNYKQNLLVAIAMGSASVLLGCGGGGGKGIVLPPGNCGSPAGSGTVVCGYVVASDSTSGVNGAVVRVRNVSGATIATGTTSLVGGSAGYYSINVPTGSVPALISVDVPSTGYLPNYLKFKGRNYDATRSATVGGPCVPSVTVTANQDNRIYDHLYIYSDASAPPPPVFVCPR